MSLPPINTNAAAPPKVLEGGVSMQQSRFNQDMQVKVPNFPDLPHEDQQEIADEWFRRYVTPQLKKQKATPADENEVRLQFYQENQDIAPGLGTLQFNPYQAIAAAMQTGLNAGNVIANPLQSSLTMGLAAPDVQQDLGWQQKAFPGIQTDPGMLGQSYRALSNPMANPFSAIASMLGSGVGSFAGGAGIAKGLGNLALKNPLARQLAAGAIQSGIQNAADVGFGRQNIEQGLTNFTGDQVGNMLGAKLGGDSRIKSSIIQGLTGGATGYTAAKFGGQSNKDAEIEALMQAAQGAGFGAVFPDGAPVKRPKTTKASTKYGDVRIKDAPTVKSGFMGLKSTNPIAGKAVKVLTKKSPPVNYRAMTPQQLGQAYQASKARVQAVDDAGLTRPIIKKQEAAKQAKMIEAQGRVSARQHLKTLKAARNAPAITPEEGIAQQKKTAKAVFASAQNVPGRDAERVRAVAKATYERAAAQKAASQPVTPDAPADSPLAKPRAALANLRKYQAPSGVEVTTLSDRATKANKFYDKLTEVDTSKFTADEKLAHKALVRETAGFIKETEAKRDALVKKAMEAKAASQPVTPDAPAPTEADVKAKLVAGQVAKATETIDAINDWADAAPVLFGKLKEIGQGNKSILKQIVGKRTKLANLAVNSPSKSITDAIKAADERLAKLQAKYTDDGSKPDAITGDGGQEPKLTDKQRADLVTAIADNEKFEATRLAEELGWKYGKTPKNKQPSQAGNWYTITAPGYPGLHIDGSASAGKLLAAMSKYRKANKGKNLGDPLAMVSKAIKKKGYDDWLISEAKTVMDNPDLTADGVNEGVTNYFNLMEVSTANDPKFKAAEQSAKPFVARIEKAETIEDATMALDAATTKLANGQLSEDGFALVEEAANERMQAITEAETGKYTDLINAAPNLEDLADISESVHAWATGDKKAELTALIARRQAKLEAKMAKAVEDVASLDKRLPGVSEAEKANAKRISRAEYEAMQARTPNEAIAALPPVYQPIAKKAQSLQGKMAKIGYAAEISGHRAENSVNLSNAGYNTNHEYILPDTFRLTKSGQLTVQTIDTHGQISYRHIHPKEAFVVEGKGGGKFYPATQSHIGTIEPSNVPQRYRLSDDGKGVYDMQKDVLVPQVSNDAAKNTELNHQASYLGASGIESHKQLAKDLLDPNKTTTPLMVRTAFQEAHAAGNKPKTEAEAEQINKAEGICDEC